MKVAPKLQGIAYYLPDTLVTNEQIAEYSADWTAEKILKKTGIFERRYASENEFASDLAVGAAKKLFADGKCSESDIDYLLFCTQSPDYLLPTTACFVQDRLGLDKSIGAIDINQGCSGYIYGLGLADGLIQSGQAKNVLFLTADTYSKYLLDSDLSVRTLFGDGATATLIQADSDDSCNSIGPFVYGTDGAGARNLIVSNSATHNNGSASESQLLSMNGAEIFSFTLKAVPDLVDQLLDKANCNMDQVDLFVFHQANQYMLEHLRKKINIAEDKFLVSLKNTGNTVSSSIPMALAQADSEGKLSKGMKVMLIGFGVGYSWGGTFLHWSC